MPGYKETVQTFYQMKMFFGLIAQFGLVLGQVNPEDFNDIAQVRFFMNVVNGIKLFESKDRVL